MEQVTRRTVLALAMPATLFALARCGTTVTSAPGGDVNAADLEFVTQAYNIITFDHEECSLAPTYAHTPAVKEIAARLLNRANAFAAKLDPIVKARASTRPPNCAPTCGSACSTSISTAGSISIVRSSTTRSPLTSKRWTGRKYS
jgi:hypothetical protein